MISRKKYPWIKAWLVFRKYTKQRGVGQFFINFTIMMAVMAILKVTHAYKTLDEFYDGLIFSFIASLWWAYADLMIIILTAYVVWKGMNKLVPWTFLIFYTISILILTFIQFLIL